jgi:hypothetical protein
MPCSKLEVSTVQHGTLSGAGYLHQSPSFFALGVADAGGIAKTFRFPRLGYASRHRRMLRFRAGTRA